jgi:hypothetical protein
MFVSKEVEELGRQIIEHPEDWSQDSYCFKSDRLEIWTANGVFYIDSYPETNMFNIFEQFYIRRVISYHSKIMAIKGIN